MVESGTEGVFFVPFRLRTVTLLFIFVVLYEERKRLLCYHIRISAS
jgi:hypothetical protein